MKKLIIQLFIASVISTSALAQVPKNETYASYGFFSVQEIASELAYVIIFTFAAEDFTIKAPVGPIIAGYRRNLSEHFSVGLQGSYSGFDKEYTILSSSKIKIQSKFITVMLNSNYSYIPRNIVQFYSGLSAGFSVFSESDSLESESKTVFAFHVNALGIRVGKSIGGFLELGFGFNGIINAGLSVKF